MPFLWGAGYLRELHEDDAFVEEGLEYHAGGGIKWWFGQGRRRVGVRGEAGISIRDGGFDFEDGQRIVPTAGGFWFTPSRPVLVQAWRTYSLVTMNTMARSTR